ncbi:CoA transferase, partial [Pseudomonas sp.]
IGRQDLAEDVTLACNDGRDARRDEIYGVIDRWVGSLRLEQVLATLNQAEVPASRIFSAEDMFHDPQFLAREMLLSAKLPDGKAFKMPGIVPKLSDTPGEVNWVGPELGEHNEHVLSGLGYSREQIASLRDEGAI